MAAKKKTTPPSTPAPSAPVATIYQNSDQVAGILQQLFNEPLIVDETRERSSNVGDETSLSSSGSVSGQGGARVPLLGELTASASGELGAVGSWTATTGTAARQQFVYSQAYYLHLVRRQLADSGILHRVSAAKDAARVTPGAFVEYTTTFDPVELTIALEVITPELVDAITQWKVRKDYVASFPEEFEARSAHAEKMKIEAEAKGALAQAIATAVQADARQSTTREYYGRIAKSPALTAITVCEREHFIAADPDRLLDGTFTVFGKVISGIEDDVATFARNKLLRNFSADAFDSVVGEMHAKLAGSPAVSGMKPDSFLDLKLDSRVRGQSFGVLPLAIFS